MRNTVGRSALLLIAVLPACSLAGGAESPTGDDARRRALEYGVSALEAGDYDAAAERLAPVAAICPVDALGSRAMLLLAAAELDGRNPAGRADAAAEMAAFQLARAGGWEGALAERIYTIALDFGADPIAVEDIPDARVIWTRYLGDEDGMAAGAPLDADAAAVDDVAPADSALAADVPADEAERRVYMAEAQAAARAARRMSDAADAGPRCTVPAVAVGLTMPELDGTPLAHRRAAAPPVATGRPALELSADVRALQQEVERLRNELSQKDQELDRIRRTLQP